MTLRAAVTKVDITPQTLDGIYVAGFSHNKPATGIHERLHARVLCLADDRGPVILVAVDLIGLCSPDIDHLRDRCPDIPGDRIFVAATHTHAGPDTIGLWGKHLLGIPVVSGRNERYIEWMIQRISDAVRTVVDRTVPVRIGFAEDRSDKTDWIVNIQVEGRAYYDHVCTVMKIETTAGEPLACLSNFACHPESLGDGNTELSSDFVGFLHDTVERHTGAMSIFFNGALGAMVTANTNLENANPDDQKQFAERMGRHLGEIVARRWADAPTREITTISTAFATIRVPVQNRMFRFLFQTGLLPGRLHRREVETSLFSLTLGDAQLASLPGEAAPVTGFAAKQMMRRRYRFLIGLGNDELGYLLNASQYDDRRSYGYERTVSLGPRALETIMDGFRRLVGGRE